MNSSIRKFDLFHRFSGFLLLPALCICFPFTHAEPDVDNWWDENLEDKALSVNEGDLVFLPPQSDKKVHHHYNRITLHPSSLSDGWITLHQCHAQIDAVPEAQIVYRKGRVRDLNIDFSRNIGRVWVEGHTVQLRDIVDDAELCIKVNSQALTSNPDGTYTLSNGPFMRRFLDGYYPMHVTMDITLPSNCLRFEHMSPQRQYGLEVRQGTDRLSIDTWFEGRLVTVITFSSNIKNDPNEKCAL